MTLPGGETRVLLVARDAEVIEQVQLATQEVDWLRFVGYVTRPEEAAEVAREKQADVVLLDDSVLDDTKQVVMDIALAAPDLLVLVLVSGQDVAKVQEALLSGARGFITKPISSESFANAITRIVTLENLRQAKGERAEEERGSIYTFISAKGAVGKSVLLVNLGVALKSLGISSVLVVELMSLPGDIAILLNLLHPVTLEDVFANEEGLSATYLTKNLVQYDEDVYVLPTIQSYLGGDFSTHGARALLQLAKRLFDVILVDTGELQDPLTEVALTEADKVFVVLAPDLLSLHRTIKFWKALQESELIHVEKMALLLNQAGKEWGLSRSRLEQLMDVNMYATVRYDDDVVEESVRRGVPFVQAFKRSAIAEDVTQLAERLVALSKEHAQASAANEEEDTQVEKATRSRWRFFSRS